MNTKLVALFFAAASTLASAQLSSPVAGAPAGTGAGVHSPNSPIAPLPARADVLPWSLLTDVKTKNVKGSISPVFNASQMALNQRVQRVQGFMMPLDPGEKHSHFLLSSVPLSCGFCTPGGPESMVEVKSRVPVRYSIEPVVVEGHFQVLVNDPFGIYYRMADASPVR
jgi:uncharacterized protein